MSGLSALLGSKSIVRSEESVVSVSKYCTVLCTTDEDK